MNRELFTFGEVGSTARGRRLLSYDIKYHLFNHWQPPVYATKMRIAAFIMMLWMSHLVALGQGIEDVAPADTIETPEEVPDGFHSRIRAIELDYGIWHFHSMSIPDSLGEKDALKWSQSIGTTFKYTLNLNRSRGIIFDASVTLRFGIPTQFSLDSAQARLWFFYWGLMVFGQDILHRNDKLDMIIGVGFNQGVHYLSVEDNQIKHKYHHLYFAPKAIAEFRALLKKVTVGARVEYQYDVTGKYWKSDTAPNLTGGNVSGIGANAFIGYSF